MISVKRIKLANVLNILPMVVKGLIRETEKHVVIFPFCLSIVLCICVCVPRTFRKAGNTGL